MSRSTILVVSKDDTNLNLIRINLTLNGYDAICVKRDAIAWYNLMIAPKRFHAIILDQIIFDLDEMDLLIRVRADDNLKMLPVLLLSKHNSCDNLLTSLMTGANYYFTKSFNYANLLSCLEESIADYKFKCFLRNDLFLLNKQYKKNLSEQN